MTSLCNFISNKYNLPFNRGTKNVIWMKKINVVMCGMRFSAAFVPIYRDHPDVESVGICDPNPEVLKAVVEAH